MVIYNCRHTCEEGNPKLSKIFVICDDRIKVI